MVHVNKVKRKKWDQNSNKMIFVGYDSDVKGYRCINRKTRRLTISRDVIFHEPVPKSSINLDADESLNGTINDTPNNFEKQTTINEATNSDDGRIPIAKRR